jgi:two-component system, NtrC family, sensor histidine kinase HydH
MVDFGSDLRKRTLVLCAALALAIAFSVLLRGRSRSVHILFAAFAGDIALWYLSQALYGFFQASIWARFTALLAVLLPQLAILLFETILPPPEGKPGRLRRTARILALPVVLLELSPYHGYGWARGIVFFYVFGLVAAALTSFAWRGRQSPSRATQGRVRYLVVVGALATTFSLADFLWFIGAELPPVGSVLSVIFLFALAQSLGRERLLDLYELLGRLMVATALAFTLAGIFYICVTVIGRFSTMYLNAVLAAVVILVLFEPLRLKVEEKIHQIFFRERHGLETAVGAAQRRLSHTLEIDEMQSIVLGALESSRRTTAAALYLRDTEGSSFALAGAYGCQAPAQLELTAANPLFDRLARAGSVLLEDLGREVSEGRSDDADAERILAAATVLGPLRTGAVLGIRGEGRDLLGALIVTDDRARDAFSPEDLGLLESLAAQISVVLENSRVYARMKIRDRLAALGQMAAGLAHEIKNPLGAIKGAAQLLADPSPGAAPLDSHAREFIGIILEEVDRLDRVVGSVLDYARPSPDSPTAVDVNAIVRRTTQIVSSSCEADQSIALSLQPDVPPARIDAEKLRQVLMNLIQNGLQAMSGRGVVTVSTRARKAPPSWGANADKPTQWLEIAVADLGPGISKKVLKNLFVPFFTTKDSGTGLGLAISQRIVQSAGGSIEIATQEGEGTTFSVLLPAATDSTPLPRDVGEVAADGPPSSTGVGRAVGAAQP